MFNFIFQKILNKKWMILSLLVGNLLMVAVATANPMYSQAVLQRALVREMRDYLISSNQHPGTIVARNSFSPLRKDKNLAGIQATEDMLRDMADDLNVAVLEEVCQWYCSNVQALHELQVTGRKNELPVKLTSYSNIEDHVKITNGRMYSDEIHDHVIEVIVNERTFVENNLTLDEELELTNFTDPAGVPYKARIVGIIEQTSEQDPYWRYPPLYVEGQLCFLGRGFQGDSVRSGEYKNRLYCRMAYGTGLYPDAGGRSGKNAQSRRGV